VIRRKLVEANLLDAVIGLPANLFYGTGIPAAVLLFRKHKPDATVVFIDASREYEAGTNQNRLRVVDLDKIVATYKARQSVARYAHVYDALNAFSKTLQIAVGSAKFHEDTPRATVTRYLDDLKYFRSLRSAVKQRYNGAIDYKEYEDQIRNMVDKHVGADEVKQIIKPVNIFQVNSLAAELDGIAGSAAKADFIASRVKKTCTEKMEEDPVLWQKLSEVIDEAIKAYLEKRLSEEEYLQKMLDAWKEAREQGATNVPADLRANPEAQAYFRLLQSAFGKTAGAATRTDLAAIAAETALKAAKVVEGRKIRDWAGNRDVENAMLNDLDDLMYSVKGRYELPLANADIDGMLEGIIRIAKRRDMPQ
jgi:type I restriction enzyme R subunit